MDIKKKRQGVISLEEAKKRFHEYYNKRSSTEIGKFRSKLFDMMHQKKPQFTLKPGQPGSEKYMLEEGPRTFDMEGVDAFPEGEEFELEYKGKNKKYISKGATFKDKSDDSNVTKDVYGPRLKNRQLYSKHFRKVYNERKNLDEEEPGSLKNKNLVDIHWDKWRNEPNYKNKSKTKSSLKNTDMPEFIDLSYEDDSFRIYNNGDVQKFGDTDFYVFGNLKNDNLSKLREFIINDGLAWPSSIDGMYEFPLKTEQLPSSDDEKEEEDQDDPIINTHYPGIPDKQISINLQTGYVYNMDGELLKNPDDTPITISQLTDEFEITNEQLYKGYVDDSDKQSTPRTESTTGSPALESTTGSPEAESTTGSPEAESTTGSPEAESTTGSPALESTMSDKARNELLDDLDILSSDDESSVSNSPIIEQSNEDSLPIKEEKLLDDDTIKLISDHLTQLDIFLPKFLEDSDKEWKTTLLSDLIK